MQLWQLYLASTGLVLLVSSENLLINLSVWFRFVLLFNYQWLLRNSNGCWLGVYSIVYKLASGNFGRMKSFAWRLIHPLALLSFLTRPKYAKTGLSLLRNRTETLATQANLYLTIAINCTSVNSSCAHPPGWPLGIRIFLPWMANSRGWGFLSSQIPWGGHDILF